MNLRLLFSTVLLCLSFTICNVYAQDCCDDIESNNLRIETLDKRTSNIRTEVRDIENQVNENSNKIYSNENTIESNIQKSNENLDNLNRIKEEVTNLKNEIDRITGDTQKTTSNLEIASKDLNITKEHLNRFWIMIAAILVFFMQAGFKSLEVGLVRSVHRDAVGLKNIIDFMAVCIVFYVFGFGFMFGESFNGIIGLSSFMPTSEEMELINSKYHLEFFLFQLAFAGTAATIVSGAMSERTYLSSYLIIAIIIGLIIYPVFGHWAWGNIFIEDEIDLPWLSAMGFHDFAGSTVVHSVGAWVALAGIMILGPRENRFKPEVQDKFHPSNLSYSTLGVLILWMGWWGFNGGSTLSYGDDVSFVILNTNLSAAAGGIFAYFHALITDKKNSFVKLIGGVLGGLVAITACCDVVSPISALLIGAAAGFIHNIGYDLLIKFKLDDPVGAIPVHGLCGAWGTLSVGFFAKKNTFEADAIFENMDRMDLIFVQSIGIIAAFIFAFGVGWLMIKLVDIIIGIRIDPESEEGGNYDA